MARPKGRNQISEKGLTNEQVVVLALAMLGGDTHVLDTEDVAIRADEIAPNRYRWRKYPQHINIELVHTALRDAKRLGSLVRGAGSKGWQLTAAGLDLVRTLETHGLTAVAPRRRVDPKERTWLVHEKGRLLAEDAFRKFGRGAPDSISRRDAERFFRIDEYVVGEARRARIQRIVNAFMEDAELGVAVKVVAEKAL